MGINWYAAGKFALSKLETARNQMSTFTLECWQQQTHFYTHPPHIELSFIRHTDDLRHKETISDTDTFQVWQANPPEEEMAQVAEFATEIAELCNLRIFRDRQAQPGRLVYRLKPDYKRDFAS